MGRFLVNLVLFLAVLGVLSYWFRGYSPPLRRAYQRFRNTLRVLRQARDTMRDAQNGAGGFNTRVKDFTQQGKVVDVPPAQFKVVCPVCGDSLTEAQTTALRQRSLRCPGSSRVGQDCPYYGRALN